MANRFNVFLANPAPAAERIGFSFITPRALPVLAAVTQGDYVDRLRVVDQAVDEFPFDQVGPGDLVGISVHTFNAIHGYALAREAKKRGATVVFGGPHASIFPEETLRNGDAVVTGDGEIAWSDLLADYAADRLQRTYSGGRAPGKASYRRVGMSCRSIDISSHRFRRYAAVRSRAPSARCGCRTAGFLAFAQPTPSFRRFTTSIEPVSVW